MKNSFLWIVFIAVLAVFVSLLYIRQQPRDEELYTAVPVQEEVPPAQDSASAIRYPIQEQISAGGEKTLPALDESDAAAQENFADLFNQGQFRKLFLLDHLIRRIVVTIDNLDGEQLPQKYLPVRNPVGPFLTAGGETITSSPDNYTRYAPYVRVAEAVSTEKLVSTYVRLYPLFQQAYVSLGNPSGYFNDRLVEILEHLLATPELREPAKLVQPKVLYVFADPELEKLSAGQKILLRIGPDNAAIIKTKISELRQQLTNRPGE